MAGRRLWLLVGLAAAGVLPLGCSGDESGSTKAGAATVEAVAGSDQTKITLTQEAAGRIDPKLVAIRDFTTARKIIPYSAVLYDACGETWIYTNAEPRVYVRHKISIDRIEGQDAILIAGPAVGVSVVTTGVAQLYGVELGVGR